MKPLPCDLFSKRTEIWLRFICIHLHPFSSPAFTSHTKFDRGVAYWNWNLFLHSLFCPPGQWTQYVMDKNDDLIQRRSLCKKLTRERGHIILCRGGGPMQIVEVVYEHEQHLCDGHITVSFPSPTICPKRCRRNSFFFFSSVRFFVVHILFPQEDLSPSHRRCCWRINDEGRTWMEYTYQTTIHHHLAELDERFWVRLFNIYAIRHKILDGGAPFCRMSFVVAHIKWIFNAKHLCGKYCNC